MISIHFNKSPNFQHQNLIQFSFAEVTDGNFMDQLRPSNFKASLFLPFPQHGILYSEVVNPKKKIYFIGIFQLTHFVRSQWALCFKSVNFFTVPNYKLVNAKICNFYS